MAIVKASFTRSRDAAKANVRYITHRPGKEGEKITRSLFGFDGPVTKNQTYDLIDQMKRGTYFYRLKLSTDPRKEDWDKELNLQDLTTETIRELERTLTAERGVKIQLDFVAAIHDDHTGIRHVHILAFTPGKLNRPHLKALTAGATKEAREQRTQLDRALGITKDYAIERPGRPAPLPSHRSDSLGVGRPVKSRQPVEAPSCPRCETQMTLLGNKCVCGSCGLKFSLGPQLSRGREVGRE